MNEPPWLVVDGSGAIIYKMWNRELADEDAAELNHCGLSESRPYRVEPNPAATQNP